jgi:ATPase family AAA domain-containing protein 3A/B
LDAAVLDRCDESLLFPLPDAISRGKLIKHYFEAYVRHMEKGNEKEKDPNSVYGKIQYFFHKQNFDVTIQSNVLNEEQMKRIVDATETFSGREIAKLMIAVQGATYASEDGTLTPEMVDEIVAVKVSDHKEKRGMSGIDDFVYQQGTGIGNVRYKIFLNVN